MGRVPENCGYTTQQADPNEAARIGPPTTAGLGICNGGLQVVQPSKKIYEQIIAALSTPATTDGYDFADQSLLSDTFRGRWVSLSYRYNALKTLRRIHAEIWRDGDVKNVHYILSPKPWEKRESDDETHAWWWEWNDKRLAREKEMGIQDGW
jgi:alpha-N-acetylglucosamine transferase